jgi:uncharacterized membrane protein YfcA
MNMLIQTLQQASANPYSWAIVAMLALVTLYSIYKWRACPYLCHVKEISADESRAQHERPFVAGARFVVVMLVGIAAIVTGLGLVAHQINPPLALLLVVAGVFTVQIEPALLRIRESISRLVSAHYEGPDAITAAEERLSYAHLWLVTANVTLLAAVVLALLAF